MKKEQEYISKLKPELNRTKGGGFYNNDQCGEKGPGAVLNTKQVIELVGLYNKGNITQKELSLKFGIGESTVNNILTRKTWSHLNLEIKKKPTIGENTKLIQELLRLKKEGVGNKKIAKLLNISTTSVRVYYQRNK